VHILDSFNASALITLEVFEHVEIGFVDQRKGVFIVVTVRDGSLEQQRCFGFRNSACPELLDNIGTFVNCLFLTFG
jgi:hypothetical protein